ncbi:MAG: MBL fold metallo-hydrolase [Endozoicomonas sp.]
MPELEYPFKNIPGPGEAMEITPGVKWVRMPMNMALDHINLYLLRDHDGWIVVDTGLRSRATQAHWETVFENELEGLPVKAVLVTHLHPDHIGQADWLCERWNAPLLMTRTEYLTARLLKSESGGNHSEEYIRFYQRAGLQGEALESLKNSTKGLGKLFGDLPRSYQRLQDGQVLSFEGRDWQIIVGRGHANEHACLYCQELNMLVAGDQVLPRITPNVSVHSDEPEANPVEEWLASQKKLMALPPVVLTLPAHNEPFLGLTERLQFIIDHHEEQLALLQKLCRTPKSAVELLPAMFGRELYAANLMFGIGECVAHLNCLSERSLLKRHENENGVILYEGLT